MGDFRFFLRQPPAAEFIRKLTKAVSNYAPNTRVTEFGVYTNVGSIPLVQSPGTTANSLSTDPFFAAALKLIESRPFIDLKIATLRTSDGFEIKFGNEKSAYFLEINRLQNATQQLTPDLVGNIADALHNEFDLLRTQEVVDETMPEAERSAFAAARSMLMEFSVQAAKLASLSSANTEQMNRVLLEKSEELERRYNERVKDLDEASGKRSKDLEDREDLFRKEKAAFDSRENTVVRRDLLKKIETALDSQKKIDITEPTTRKRIPIHCLCIVTMTASAVLAGVFAYKIVTESTSDWHRIFPFTTGTALFVSTAIFYLRWNDHWFEQHASAEFENRRFFIDVIRASWIAELLFEWKEKKEVPFPDQLITNFSRRLFDMTDPVKTTKHPFDDLKALLGNVAEIKFSQKDGVFVKKVRGN